MQATKKATKQATKQAIEITRAAWEAMPPKDKRVRKDKTRWIRIKTTNGSTPAGWQQVYWLR